MGNWLTMKQKYHFLIGFTIGILILVAVAIINIKVWGWLIMQYIKKDKLDFEPISDNQDSFIERICKRKHTKDCSYCKRMGYNRLEYCMRG